MQMTRYVRLLLLCATTMALPGFANAGRENSPFRLGYQAVTSGDEATLALLAERLGRGLATHDPYLFLEFVADDYSDRPAVSISNAPAGAIIQNVAIDRAALVQVMRQMPIGERIAEVNLQVGEMFTDGAAVHCRIDAMAGVKSCGGALLTFNKKADGWFLTASAGLAGLAGLFPAPDAPTALRLARTNERFSLLGELATPTGDMTFLPKELAPEYGISRLTRAVTLDKLSRHLFAMTAGSALFARVRQFDTAPYYEAVYVQLVTDPAWNRIVYGDYEKWIKAWDGSVSGVLLNRPQGIVTDASGQVYVADSGNGRIVVLRLTGSASDLDLTYTGSLGLGELSQPTELAWDDRGTIFDSSDDMLWVVDRGAAALVAYRLSASGGERILQSPAGAFVAPSAVAVGRFGGRSDGNIYVTDAATRTLTRYYFEGKTLQPLGVYHGEPEMLPTALATDHWGNVYLTDQSLRVVCKFSPNLEPLATLTAATADFQPVRFQPLFGTLQASGAAPLVWSGYDQAFLLEKWSETSGARRFQLGIDLRVDALALTDDLAELVLDGRLTDAGHLQIALEPAASGMPTAVLVDGYRNAGDVAVRWDRRQADGSMVGAGYYQLRFTVRSTYGQPAQANTSRVFYLPLYYAEDCGAGGNLDPHLARGHRTQLPDLAADNTVSTDPTEVVYTFTGLDPNSTYEARAAYLAANGEVAQALYADKSPLHTPMMVGQSTLRTAWLAIPPLAITEEGTLQLRVIKTGGSGDVSVAALWLREASYDPAYAPEYEPETNTVPAQFALLQNYPNPFNPTTTIAFAVPAGYLGEVTLRIYNVMGQLVRDLVRRDLSPGSYREVWDGNDNAGHKISSGMYLYQLRAGTYTATRKLLLMK